MSSPVLGQSAVRPGAGLLTKGVGAGPASASNAALAAAAGKAKAKASAVKKPVDYGDMSKWLEWDKPKQSKGSYKVLVEYVMIRSLPSLKSPVKGRLRLGDIIDGEDREEWVLITTDLDKDALSKGEGKWVLVDGASVPHLKIGRLLEKVCVAPELKKAFGNALEISLPAGCNSTYRLEIRSTRHNKVKECRKCPAGRMMIVHELPRDTALEVRLVQAKKDGKTLESEWVECSTTDFDPTIEGMNTDLLGNPRGKCKQCACERYAQEECHGQNSDWSASRCAWCGCNVEAHVIHKEETAEEAAERIANEEKQRIQEERNARLAKSKEADDRLNKALAVSKESLEAMWPLYDMKAEVSDWDRLDIEVEEVVAWSDLHADMGMNMDHLQGMPAKPKTAIILAGDIGSSLKIIESVLRVLMSKYAVVFYVPGNHELWIIKGEGLSSMHKFMAIMELCEQLGVRTRPAYVARNCAICPLFSWYKDNLLEGFERSQANIPFDIQTSWPWDIIGCGDSNDAQRHEIAQFFLKLNDKRLEVAPKVQERVNTGGASARSGNILHVITFSHFVPRQECYPGRLMLGGVMGCKEIEEQLRACGSRCHVFGHSHISVDRHLDGVRYVQHPLGYPNDYHRKTKPMRIWADPSALLMAIRRDSSLENVMDSASAPRRHAEVIASSGKWLVWNTVWYYSHLAAARALEGKAAEHHQKKAAEEQRRMEGHRDEVLRSRAICAETLEMLDSFINSCASVAIGQSVKKEVWKMFESVRVPPAPVDLEATTWEHVTKAVGFAAQSIHYQLLDEFTIRQAVDQVVIQTYHNITLWKNRPSGESNQAKFNDTWAKVVSSIDKNKGAPQVDEESLTEATLSEEIRLDFCIQIDNAPKKFTQRPPGLWEEDNIWDGKATLDKDNEWRLQRVLAWDPSKISEAWAAHADIQDIDLLVVSCDDESQEATVTVSTDITVAELKDSIRQQVGREPEGTIELLTFIGTRLLDSMLLNSLEAETLSHGLMLSGIDLSPPREVDLRIVHLDSKEELIMQVLDTSLIGDIRKAVAKKLSEPDLWKCILVRQDPASSGFLAAEENELLGGRQELFFVGRPLTAGAASNAYVKAIVHIDVELGLSFDVKAPAWSCMTQLKELVAANDITGSVSATDFRLKLRGASVPLDENVLVTASVAELELVAEAGEREE